jgi:acetyltransferase-like isoleucine patch superfamily enzyme
VHIVNITKSNFASFAIHVTPALAAWRIDIADDVHIEGTLWVPGTGRIRIGRGARLCGRRAPIELRAHAGAEIVLGENCVVEDGTSIEATRSVVVGAGARVGAFCKIIDNHFHRTVGDRFDRPEAIPVVIGEGATVGPRAVLLPGGGLAPGAWLDPATVLSFRLPAFAETAGRHTHARRA